MVRFPLDVAHGGADRIVGSVSSAVLSPKRDFLSRKRQRGRIFHRMMSGLTRCRKLGLPVRVMMLSLKRGSDADFHRCFQVLRKRIEHEFGFSLEYCIVKVDDGSRVHAHLFYFPRSLDGKPLGRKSGYISFDWLSSTWLDITGDSFVVSLNRLYGSPRKASGYYCAQYFSGQDFKLRMSYSWNWVFRGFCKLWKLVFAPCFARACCIGKSAVSDVVSAWNRVVCLDMFKLIRMYPFLCIGNKVSQVCF